MLNDVFWCALNDFNDHDAFKIIATVVTYLTYSCNIQSSVLVIAIWPAQHQNGAAVTLSRQCRKRGCVDGGGTRALTHERQQFY